MGTGSAVKLAAEDARRQLAVYGARQGRAARPRGPDGARQRRGGSRRRQDHACQAMRRPASTVPARPTPCRPGGPTFVEVGGRPRSRASSASGARSRAIRPVGSSTRSTARSQMIGFDHLGVGQGHDGSIADRADPHARFLAKNLLERLDPRKRRHSLPAPSTSALSTSSHAHASPIGARGIGELGCYRRRRGHRQCRCSTPPASGCARSRSCRPAIPKGG